ncbi:hypothetical protein CF54_17025 [Streptomyces sp. Tu 6176]|uniref:hypothetical protein n=1 Tax=Streptomyces sp. Tu 6176 TaxID=1470557 RepID=UPI00044BFDD5|nr:hypothetical protein [Streptomyces sp. Tu 6176]EYT81844.1 hypothetical protein CF54_17025 [Streptomyces sp. Tu 6176]
MSVKSLSLRAAGTVAGVALASGVLLSSGPAQAATASIGAGRVQLCAQGNYAAYLVFNTAAQDQQGVATATVAKGSCQIFDIVNYGGGRQTGISVIGRYNTSSDTFYVGGLNVDPTGGGWKLLAQGTTGNAGKDSKLVIEAAPRT